MIPIRRQWRQNRRVWRTIFVRYVCVKLLRNSYYVTIKNLLLVIGLRVQSYHDTLKYNETIISDFIERAQKQLFKFKTFLIGLSTLFDHHKESFAFRTNQWTEEWEVSFRCINIFGESKFSRNPEISKKKISVRKNNSEYRWRM